MLLQCNLLCLAQILEVLRHCSALRAWIALPLALKYLWTTSAECRSLEHPIWTVDVPKASKVYLLISSNRALYASNTCRSTSCVDAWLVPACNLHPSCRHTCALDDLNSPPWSAWGPHFGDKKTAVYPRRCRTSVQAILDPRIALHKGSRNPSRASWLLLISFDVALNIPTSIAPI